MADFSPIATSPGSLALTHEGGAWPATIVLDDVGEGFKEFEEFEEFKGFKAFEVLGRREQHDLENHVSPGVV